LFLPLDSGPKFFFKFVELDDIDLVDSGVLLLEDAEVLFLVF
jgi:hypothetical protein